MRIIFSLSVVLCAIVSIAQSAFIQMENDQERVDFLQTGRADLNVHHEVIFAVKQKNLDALHNILMEISTPFGPKFGKHLSRQEVATMTANPEATTAIEAYLLKNGAEITKKTPYGEYITARAPVALWEKLFSTNFYNFQHDSDSSLKKVVRAKMYSIDEELKSHVETVFNTVQLPTIVSGKLPPKAVERPSAAGSVTPALLKSFYNITFQDGANQGSQSVYEAIGQYYSPADLLQFESQFGIPAQNVAFDIGGFVSDSQCVSNANNCAEANLDVQYIIGLANNIPTTYWYDVSGDLFVSWITAVAATTNPPLVHSISYGAAETGASTSITTQFNTEAMKLGAQGVTIFVSSGDDGAAGSGARSLKARCGYTPSFPATSPYVTAVGATQGPESGSAEVVCDSATGGVITSGGGFSTKYAAPSWQTAAISKYLSVVSPKPVSGYATTGRGYPDLSLLGFNYQVVIGGKNYALSGTSASAPSLAALVALVNSKRLAAKKSALGFINPSIYSLYGSFVNDVTSGKNLCTAGTVCCTQGFYAAAGWDPVTGYGSVNFGKFYNALFAL